MVELDQSTEGLLIEAMRQMDEVARIEAQNPSPSTRFVLATPLSPALRDLSPEQLDTLQLVLNNNGKVQAILDKALLSDLETYQALQHLIRKGYLRESRKE
jgi:hypothetical protein